MFITFLVIDTLIAVTYFFISSRLLRYVNNGTRAEAVKLAWFLFTGFLFVVANLIVFFVSLLSIPDGTPLDDNYFVIKCVVHPIILFSFGIWLGNRGLKIFPDLLNKFKEKAIQ